MFINLQLTGGIWSRHTVSRKMPCKSCYPSELYRSQGEAQSVGSHTHAHMTDGYQSQKTDNKFKVLTSYTWQTVCAIYGS